MVIIYKILRKPEWEAVLATGKLIGSAADLADGFIHFSTGAQVAETAARHFAGEAELMLLTVATKALGAALRWEYSRDGALFPHLYGALPAAQIMRAQPLPLLSSGRHAFPAGIGAG